MPPDPAYQQILKGIPAVDYTADEIMYLMRNPRSWKVLRLQRGRADHRHGEHRHPPGAAPARLLPRGQPARRLHRGAAEGLDPRSDRRVPAALRLADGLGTSANRRRLKFMPGEFKYQEPSSRRSKTSTTSGWPGSSATPSLSRPSRSSSRSTARTGRDTAHDRRCRKVGSPLQRWVKGFIDPVIAAEFGSADLEFAWVKTNVEHGPETGC